MSDKCESTSESGVTKARDIHTFRHFQPKRISHYCFSSRLFFLFEEIKEQLTSKF